MAQIMKLSYFPQIEVKHTSKTHHGQVYVWAVNWLIMVGTVLVAAIYNNTTSLGNAYGVCVMFVTFFDTCMVTLAAILVWRFSPYLVFLPWLIIACMDATFLSAALTKVPDGAWFTITLAAVLASLFILWRFGKEQQWAAEAEDRFPTTHFINRHSDGSLALTEKYGGAPVSSIAGMGIFFDKAGETTPIIFSQFVRKLTAMPVVMVFFHLRPLEKPMVAPEERYSVSRLAIPNCYRLIVRHGYMDEVISPDLASLIYEKIRDHIIRRAVDEGHSNSASVTGLDTTSTETPAASGSDDDEKRVLAEPSIAASLDTLERAFRQEILYIIGKEQMRVKPKTNIFRAILLHTFLFLRENTRNKIASLKVQRDRVIEIGFVKDV
jgi:KUP system potassium uptake protein